MRTAVLVTSWLILFFLPFAARASIVINEIIFDPVSSDTGLEKIEIYNSDAAAIDMGGWELYPDSIGYFIFPSGFSLAAKSFVAVHLRSSGVNDAANLYHSAASANMGNSSGSAALFKPGGRSEETIVDFVRWHKPGSSERKTWESTAAEAGLWSIGTYVDVSPLAEGNSIGLASDGFRGVAASWKIYTSSSIGTPNSGTEGIMLPEETPMPTQTPQPTPLASAAVPPPTPYLRADAGPDFTATAGTIAQFRGMAFGLDGEPLSQARFLWNFGDGTTMEGRSVTHIYHFPGTYRANLAVSSGEYAGSDWLTVTVFPAKVFISEAKPGSDGFVEIFNGSDKDADISGVSISDPNGKSFHIPAGTVISAKVAIAFPNAVTGLDLSSGLKLADARSAVLEEIEFSGALPKGTSWERNRESFVVQREPTPGRFDEIAAADKPESKRNPQNPPTDPLPSAPRATSDLVLIPPPSAEIASAAPDASLSADAQAQGSEANRETAGNFLNLPPRVFFFMAGIAGSAAAAAAFLFLKRRLL